MKDKKKFDLKILDIVVCPSTKQKLTYDEKNNQLISKKAKLAYPIREGIPILLVDEAVKLKDL